jgi:hypothetical protein
MKRVWKNDEFFGLARKIYNRIATGADYVFDKFLQMGGTPQRCPPSGRTERAWLYRPVIPSPDAALGDGDSAARWSLPKQASVNYSRQFSMPQSLA